MEGRGQRREKCQNWQKSVKGAPKSWQNLEEEKKVAKFREVGVWGGNLPISP